MGIIEPVTTEELTTSTGRRKLRVFTMLWQLARAPGSVVPAGNLGGLPKREEYGLQVKDSQLPPCIEGNEKVGDLTPAKRCLPIINLSSKRVKNYWPPQKNKERSACR